MQDAPREENAYVLDAESSAEMARLIGQDLMVTRYMGGLLCENPDFTGIERVLDIACGPGGWAQEVAFSHPDIEVVGIDVSRTMIEYAQAQARVQRLDNLRFLIMDALKPLDFPDNYFDLVNIRFATGFMSTQVWPMFVQECFRVTRSGGMLRVTETDDIGPTTSGAFEKLWIKTSTAFRMTGRSFSPEGRNFGITAMLGRFLRDVGCKNIRQCAHAIDYSTGTEAHDSIFQDWMVGLKLLQPFLLMMKVTTQEEVNALYQQALGEMMADDYCAVWYFLTASGLKP